MRMAGDGVRGGESVADLGVICAAVAEALAGIVAVAGRIAAGRRGRLAAVSGAGARGRAGVVFGSTGARGAAFAARATGTSRSARATGAQRAGG